MSRIIEKYRKEAEELYTKTYYNQGSWRLTLLEAIFRPELKAPPGKGPMDMLHPDIKKMHMPHDVYMADWRKYRVEDHPALMEFQKKCHAAGLHDPWLRNIAFKFYPNQSSHKSIFAYVTGGFTFGLIAGTSLYILKEIKDAYYGNALPDPQFDKYNHAHH